MQRHFLVACGFSCWTLVMAVAHALLGWPDISKQLASAGVGAESDVSGALAAGWYFGSICMMVFSAMFAWTAWAIRQQVSTAAIAPVPLAIGMGYLLFGIGGCALRNFGSHFIAFAILGVVFVAWGIALERRRDKPAGTGISGK